MKCHVAQNADPTANNDKVDTADIGFVAQLGDAWLNATSKAIFFCKNNATGAAVWEQAGGGALPNFVAEFVAGTFDIPLVNGADTDTIAGTNGTVNVQRLDDTTEEFMQQEFTVPSDADTAATVSIIVQGFAETAAADKAIALKFYHSANGTTWDEAYASIFDEWTISSTQDAMDILTLTETLANLGWAAGDLVRIKLSRVAPEGNNLVGDYLVRSVSVVIPRA